MITTTLSMRKLRHIDIIQVSQPVSDGAKFILLNIMSHKL